MSLRQMNGSVRPSTVTPVVWLGALTVGLALGAYANALGGDFVYDDRLEILNNTSIERLSDLPALVRSNLTRPIVNLSYAVDYALWGGRSAPGFHLTNIVLHGANVVLLFALALRLGRDWDDANARPRARSVSTFIAFTAAALFAVHPLMTEAVSYVSSRSEVLAATFFLGAFLCLRRRLARGGWTWLAAGMLLFALLLGTREIAVALPFVLLAYDRLLLTNGFARAARFTGLHLPLIVVVAVLGVIRVWLYVVVEHGDARALQLGHGLLVVQSVARYVSLLVLPIGQSVVHGVYAGVTLWDGRLIAAVALVGVLALIAVRARRGQPLLALGVAWFFLALAPSSALILLTDRGQPIAEHRLYLASCGFFLATATVLGRLAAPWLDAGRRLPRPIVGAVAVTIAVLLALTVARNRVWTDPVTLWSDATQKAPLTFQAHYGLADAYRQRGDHEAAEAAYQRAIALRPNLVEGYVGLSELLVEAGQPLRACEVLRLAMLRLPSDPRPRVALAALEGARDPAMALHLCREALGLRPGFGEAEACVRRFGGGR